LVSYDELVAYLGCKYKHFSKGGNKNAFFSEKNNFYRIGKQNGIIPIFTASKHYKYEKTHATLIDANGLCGLHAAA